MSKNKNKKILSKFIGILFILFVLSNYIPTPFHVNEAGIATELSAVIQVEYGYQNDGEFLLTAVRSRRAVAWDYIYIKLFQPDDRELELMREHLPEDMDMNEYIALMAEMMEESKLQAQTVAFRRAGYEVNVSGDGAEVVEVMSEGSAYQNLEKDDLIIEIDGKKVEMAADAVNIIRDRNIGDTVQLKVLRDEEFLEFELETLELEGSEGNASIGVLIRSKGLDYEIPRNVKFETDNIVGPSAGSVFTMEIYNQLTEEDITGGKRIAGTGTVNLDGEVGRVSGVKYKVLAAEEAGVDIFIVPSDNYEEAAAAAVNLEVIAADKIDDIIEYLNNLLEI
ncbi:YlbL family protein [Halanaerobium hydrogeniformans]|uniref:endopeptidase La n=1 Tax=Halanaerobium hydrogeniformans TaxID=656519 RepID=E4RLR9_HALHG|nr:PDZ domain-containing protein [Halanaerobium hydrogeniformans]ADQ14983.1 PDZ/DHR/GLGF domain protein [Halanaerobium hydrogeniformans]